MSVCMIWPTSLFLLRRICDLYLLAMIFFLLTLPHPGRGRNRNKKTEIGVSVDLTSFLPLPVILFFLLSLMIILLVFLLFVVPCIRKITRLMRKKKKDEILDLVFLYQYLILRLWFFSCLFKKYWCCFAFFPVFCFSFMSNTTTAVRKKGE